ncbi:NAD(P)-dependent oxidoreductase [Longibacter salinarum]|uniref:NAD(P)-dependent oxidoreductase n=1 Tax=Longibacter salinarum TaxID=1850348 RepID=A0A2A8CZ04_9BACT|nr:SDR family oxidoreductase [Longibacter salinarum]PEN13831.1 NAD(P)-dependent oxidoreductase [Longibacter salinarum]
MSDSKPQRILVSGATGYVGGRLVPCLLQAGYDVCCFVRSEKRLRAQPWGDRVRVAVGDAMNEEDIEKAMEGIDVAYFLIHSLGTGEDFAERDRKIATNFRRAAEKKGVQRIIYMGGMRPKGEQKSEHLLSRIETGDHLRDGPVPVTEFRAAQIIGSGSLSFELVRYLTERIPVLICPKWVSTPTQPIAIRNVLQYLTSALETPESTGETIEIGGADVLTYGDMFRAYAKVRDLQRTLIAVPFFTPRLSSHWVGLVTPIANSIARPLIEGLDNEVVVDDPDRARSMFPDIEPIKFEAALRLALRRAESDEVPTVWNSARSSSPRANEMTADLETTEGLYKETRRINVHADADTAFDVIKSLGGQTGWLYADPLWHVRGWLDQLSGGVGFRRGRRNPTDLRVGDAVDFWRVESMEEVGEEKMLRLRAEMRLPGRAWLQFEVEPIARERCRVTQQVFFEPKGLTGTIYWNMIAIPHRIVYAGMMRALRERIETRAYRLSQMSEETSGTTTLEDVEAARR